MIATSQDILHFWFKELSEKQHFVKDPALDADIRQRFGATLEAAARCELFGWRSTAQGRLAEIVVLDQFSRNIFRDTPRAFAQDPLALVLAALIFFLHRDNIRRLFRGEEPRIGGKKKPAEDAPPEQGSAA